jgi:hypothetical protein
MSGVASIHAFIFDTSFSPILLRRPDFSKFGKTSPFS